MDDNSIDFEAIDQAIERHKTRIETEKKIKKDTKPKAPVKKVVKKPTVKPAVKPVAKKTPAKPKPEEPKVVSKPKPVKEDVGENIAVKVIPKKVEEPAVSESKPNPKTGKYLDFRNEKSDMTINRTKKRSIPIKLLAATIETTTTITEVKPAVVAVPIVDASPDPEPATEVIPEPIAMDAVDVSVVSDDMTIGDMMDIAEEAAAQIQDESDSLVDMGTINDDIDDMENDLPLDAFEQPFLDKVVVEKRPLSGGEATEREIDMRELLTAEESMIADMDAEKRADEEFIADEPNDGWMSANNNKPEKPVKVHDEKASQPTIAEKPAKSKLNVLFYILLVLLLIILGCSIGALIYFSDVMSML